MGANRATAHREAYGCAPLRTPYHTPRHNLWKARLALSQTVLSADACAYLPVHLHIRTCMCMTACAPVYLHACTRCLTSCAAAAVLSASMLVKLGLK
jgi:hypothetical protein